MTFFGRFRTQPARRKVRRIGLPHALKMSDAYNSYLARHSGNVEILRKANWCFHRWHEIVGNIGILNVRRSDIREFIAAELGRGIRTNSIKTEIALFRAAVWSCGEDHDVNLYNPFHRVPIPKLGFDKRRWAPATSQDVRRIQATCIEKDDDVRWLIALVSDTGARLREIAGMAVSDINLDADIPHLTIQGQPWRQLKTKHSQRQIPLVGVALWGARRVVENAAPQQAAAFPRYIKDGVFHDPSSTLRYWLRTRNFNYTVHGFRHIFLDRLREAGCPVDVRRVLCGWSPYSFEVRYGYGFSLAKLHDWISRICASTATPPAPKVNLTPRLPLYQCILKVVIAIAGTSFPPDFKELVQLTGLESIDVTRGLSVAARTRLVVLFPRHIRPYRVGFYVATGKPPPKPPKDLQSVALYALALYLVRRHKDCVRTADCFGRLVSCDDSYSAPGSFLSPDHYREHVDPIGSAPRIFRLRHKCSGL